MIRRRVLPVLVGLGSIASGAGCGDAADKKTETSARAEPTAEAKRSSTPTAKPTTAPTETVIKQGDPIPIRLGGAAMPVPRPTASPSGSAALAPAPAAPKAAAPARAGAAAAPAEAAAAPAPATVGEIKVVHNHPPDQPCTPLGEDEIKKAFSDLN